MANVPDGGQIIAPSAIAAKGDMWTDTQGMQQNSVPREIPTEDIAVVIGQYASSAKAAMEAGFDGVEIHAANGYLPQQFLSPGSNQRTDMYGGSHENRNRFVLELATAVTAAIGNEKVGIRLSPYNPYNDIAADEHEYEQYMALTAGLKEIGLVYVHFLTFAMPANVVDDLRDAFGGAVILNGGYTAERAEADLQAGRADLISFGNKFISNPDLVHRMEIGAPLVDADQSTFYTPGEQGFNDYVTLA
jgi:N-ethylmaleimide reductase